ncbi:endonuclease [Polaribacter litorisediminis]|uniref:endonuclease n=1 Tax=Polaribacter litorisediminis TaxID=1908341 RepID=UPI001CBFEB31|nr:endonuclease [Polaribacter litorisediminis]UAM99204.1 endonuclease [Polaribacter litorisediminis]
MIKKLLTLTITLLSFTVTFSQETYYNDVDLTLTGIALKDALATKITATHTNFLVYTPGVWEASKVTDVNPTNSSEILLIYGYENGSDGSIDNDRERGINNNGGGNSDWNREHVFARSLGNPNLGTTGPGADAHHLRPSDPGRNSSRNNRKFGRGTGNSGFSTVDFHDGLDGPNTAAWYPGDEWKGDVARMMMYMYVRYGSVCLPTAVGVGSTQFTPDEMIDLFLVWNIEDPVSDFEKQRNPFHENTNNTYAQGNRNPFIDNPYLATRIWGGDSAQDLWGIYTSSDTEAPTAPTNLVASSVNITNFTVSWTASDDNEAVTGYNVYVDGVLTEQTSNTTVTISGLSSNTTYTITVLAKDIANNQSALSTPLEVTTLEDTEAPTTPAEIVVNNISDTAFTISWSAATDNSEVASYDVYLDGSLNTNTINLTHTFTGLVVGTSYSAYVIAKDAAGNSSAQSATVNATTVASSGVASELFFSEYVEPATGNNKALEIVNLTGSTVSLAGYSIKKQSDGSGPWVDVFDISNGSVNTIIPGDVFVITHIDAADPILVAESDLVGPPNIDTNPNRFGSPLNFNGNDPIGLFKNDVLIDVVGEVNQGSSYNFIQNITLRRNANVTGPSTTYNEQAEWTFFDADKFDGIGFFTSSLSTENNLLDTFKMYPNPTNGNFITIKTTSNTNVTIYNTLGKVVKTTLVTANKNSIDISNLSKGVYFVKLKIDQKSITQKLIKN